MAMTLSHKASECFVKRLLHSWGIFIGDFMTGRPKKTIYQHARPGRFLAMMQPLVPVVAVISMILLAAGLYYGLWASPVDYQQGQTVRIMYVHVPSAWMALMIYASMAGAAGVA